MPSDLLALARRTIAMSVATDREISEKSEQSPPPAPLSSLSSLMSHRLATSRRRCFTCGEPATGSFDDGSPRWHHGHDRVTGVRWTVPVRLARIGRVRTCPACGSDHAVGTTCAAPTGCDISERSEESPRPVAGDAVGTTCERSEESPDHAAIDRPVFGDDPAGTRR